MSYMVQLFLETEITCLPQVMRRYMGKFYNNTLYNGITWMVLILHILRFSFEFTVNALLKKMGFKEYLRIRLRKSLWYLGFYTCCYLYCSATLWKNDIDLPDEEKFLTIDLTEPLSGHLILGYVLLCAFYISSATCEALLCSFMFFNYLFLTGFVAFTYFFSYIELAILLSKSICMYHILTEISRCLACTIKAHLNLPRHLVNISVILSLIAFVQLYVFAIPRGFMIPIGHGLLHNSNSIIIISLNVTLWGWFLCELYVSPMCRLVIHEYRHSNTSKIVPQCLGSIVECALFEQRDDVAYNLNIIKTEIKEQEDRLKALRRPKQNAKMLLKTLKCMAIINRKIQRKRNISQAEEDQHTRDETEVSNKVLDSNFNVREADTTVETDAPEQDPVDESTSTSIEDKATSSNLEQPDDVSNH